MTDVDEQHYCSAGESRELRTVTIKVVQIGHGIVPSVSRSVTVAGGFGVNGPSGVASGTTMHA